MLPVFLDCPFFIIPSIFSNFYLSILINYASDNIITNINCKVNKLIFVIILLSDA